MKRFRGILVVAAILSLPSMAHAYIGARIGMVDESNFGYGLVLGAGLPMNLGLDFAMAGSYKNETNVKTYWVQSDFDLTYDFNWLWKKVSETIELHPYIKGGFTYAGAFIDNPVVTETKASHGPGFNIGGGIDWKILGGISIGVDLGESIIDMSGVTVSGIQLAQDSTAHVFNVLFGIKFFSY